jgi:hypothetical protein
MLSEENTKWEEDVIKTILLNNGYHVNSELNYRKPKPTMNMTTMNNTSKQIMLTYHGPAVRTTTKFFRNTEMKIAYKTENTLISHLWSRKAETNKYKLSGWTVGNAHACTQGKQDDHLKQGKRNTLGRSKTMGRTPNLPYTYKIQDTNVGI